MEESVRTNLLGGAAGGAPPPKNLLAQATVHAPAKAAPPSTSGGWGEGRRAWLCLGAGLRGGPGGRGAQGAVAPRGDVRSSWSWGLPPAADVRTVNNREGSVEGGIPRCSLRSPSSRPSPSPGPARSLGWWSRRGGGRGGARGERCFGRRPRGLEWRAPRRLPLLNVRRCRGARDAPSTALGPGRLRDHMLACTRPLRGRSAGRVGAGLIGRPEAVDPLPCADIRGCRT